MTDENEQEQGVTVSRRKPRLRTGGDGAPKDLFASSFSALADIAGLHRNCVLNYRRKGIEPTGEPPWSLKDYYLTLRGHGKLGEAKPKDIEAQALKSWCFGAGNSIDPDDPVHQPPQGWQEEKLRQSAIMGMYARKMQQIELETLQKERIPIASYRERWKRRAQHVLSALDLIMAIPKDVPDLPEKQRQQLVAACRKAITDIRARIVGNG